MANKTYYKRRELKESYIREIDLIIELSLLLFIFSYSDTLFLSFSFIIQTT